MRSDKDLDFAILLLRIDQPSQNSQNIVAKYSSNTVTFVPKVRSCSMCTRVAS